MESMDEVLARKTVKNYACSNCWGDLELVPDMRDNGVYFVICQKCKDETKGYVTKYFVEQRRNQNEFERMDAIRTLRKAGILPPAPELTEKQKRAIFDPYAAPDTSARTKKSDFQFEKKEG